jgi:predicted CopG family antitoxin
LPKTIIIKKSVYDELKAFIKDNESFRASGQIDQITEQEGLSFVIAG